MLVAFLLLAPASFLCECPVAHESPSLFEVVETRFAVIEDQLFDDCEDTVVALCEFGNGDPLLLLANLQHLRGSLTRWLKGAASHFG